MYLVESQTGEYDSYLSSPVFVTQDKKTAEDFVNKANKVFKRLVDFYREENEKNYKSQWWTQNLEQNIYEQKRKEVEVFQHKYTKFDYSFSFTEIELR